LTRAIRSAALQGCRSERLAGLKACATGSNAGGRPEGLRYGVNAGGRPEGLRYGVKRGWQA